MQFETEENLINVIIKDYFDDKPLNGQGVAYITSDEKFVPRELRDIFRYLKLIFRKKSWYLGGSIPEELIYNQNNFHLLQNISLKESVDFIHGLDDKVPAVKEVVVKIIKIIHECERKGIQQEYIGGILLLYFILCENLAVS